MAKLHVAVILAVFMALVFVTVEGNSKRLRARDLEGSRHRPLCTTDPQRYPYLPVCSTTTTEGTTTESITTIESTTTIETTTTSEQDEDTNTFQTDSTSPPSSLQRAHWCRVINGTFIPLDYTYMQNPCVMCKCMISRAIRCQTIQCMPTYCIDDSAPIRPNGQCCTQCSYERSNTSCVYNGVTFQHGAIITAIEDKMQCWCQLGNIECRDYAGAFSGTDMWSDGTTIYIIVIVIVFALILGLLTCCACTLFTYYYYYKYQHTIQQAYDEYVSTAGWQPVEEEQSPDDLAAEEKRLEAEQGQYLTPNVETIPPPYATIHNIKVPADEQQQ